MHAWAGTETSQLPCMQLDCICRLIISNKVMLLKFISLLSYGLQQLLRRQAHSYMLVFCKMSHLPNGVTTLLLQ